jgi:glycine/D-amino acid oxidase-like deaminating enzyme
MSAAEFDVIIVGGGHNGLTCGAYLARAGKKVLVLERRHLIGGAAVTSNSAPLAPAASVGGPITTAITVIELLRSHRRPRDRLWNWIKRVSHVSGHFIQFRIDADRPAK